jgi:hypothetical protein
VLGELEGVIGDHGDRVQENASVIGELEDVIGDHADVIGAEEACSATLWV